MTSTMYIRINTSTACIGIHGVLSSTPSTCWSCSESHSTSYHWKHIVEHLIATLVSKISCETFMEELSYQESMRWFTESFGTACIWYINKPHRLWLCKGILALYIFMLSRISLLMDLNPAPNSHASFIKVRRWMIFVLKGKAIIPKSMPGCIMYMLSRNSLGKELLCYDVHVK